MKLFSVLFLLKSYFEAFLLFLQVDLRHTLPNNLRSDSDAWREFSKYKRRNALKTDFFTRKPNFLHKTKSIPLQCSVYLVFNYMLHFNPNIYTLEENGFSNDKKSARGAGYVTLVFFCFQLTCRSALYNLDLELLCIPFWLTSHAQPNIAENHSTRRLSYWVRVEFKFALEKVNKVF